MTKLVLTLLGATIAALSETTTSPHQLSSRDATQIWITREDFAVAIMTSQRNSEVIYQKLSDRMIRVLDLQPGSAADPILVELRAVSIDNPGPYEALSYTWGSAANLFEISVNGHAFSATENLFAALTRFRDATKSRALWIDAISINQSSIEERSQQVRLMTEIYSTADRVLAWMGESKNESALKMLFDVAHERNDYATVKQWLEQQDGDIALFLFSEEARCVEIVAAVKEEFSRVQDRAFTSRTQLPAELGQLEESPNILFIGYRKWLGQLGSDDGSQPIMVIVPDFEINQVQRSASQSYPTFEKFLIDAAKPPLLELSGEKMVQVLDGLVDLLDRPYWQRAWIVQEVIASRNCTVCFSKQNQEIDIETLGSVYDLDKRTGLDIRNFMVEDFGFFDATKNLAVVQQLASIPFKDKAEFYKCLPTFATFSQLTYHRKSHAEKTWRFDRLLKSYSSQKATDARDKIFSLIGLLQCHTTSSEEVDWCRRAIDYDLDIRDVYINAARYLVGSYRQRSHGDSDILSTHILDDFYQTRDESSNFAKLPTWVPNWASETDKAITFNTARTREIDTLIPYDACVSGDSLILSGHVVDEVSWVSNVIDGGAEMHKELSLWLWVLQNGMGAVYGGRDARFDAFWRTIIVDNPGGTKDQTDLTYHFKGHDLVKSWLAHCKDKVNQVRVIREDELHERTTQEPLEDSPDNGSLGIRSWYSQAQTSKLRILHAGVEYPLGIVNEEITNWEEIKDALLQQMQDDDSTWQSQGARMELSRRHFIVTEKGYFGLASPGVQKGDVLVLLAGSACPWYLHRYERNSFVVSARAWVHGLMYESDEYYTDWATKEITRIELR